MEDITVTELQQKIESDGHVQLLDVREPHEREEFNIGGEFIPLGELTSKMADLPFDKEKEVIVYCRSGNRSGVAKELMEKNGFDKARNLLGGMLAWSKLMEKE
jgi:rhodanese-related sulfurtransferase